MCACDVCGRYRERRGEDVRPMMSARCPGARGDDDLRERVLGVCRRGGENRDKRGAAADDGVWAGLGVPHRKTYTVHR